MRYYARKAECEMEGSAAQLYSTFTAHRPARPARACQPSGVWVVRFNDPHEWSTCVRWQKIVLQIKEILDRAYAAANAGARD